MCTYYRFAELYGSNQAVDRVRQQQLPKVGPTLDYLDEAFTSENWIASLFFFSFSCTILNHIFLHRYGSTKSKRTTRWAAITKLRTHFQRGRSVERANLHQDGRLFCNSLTCRSSVLENNLLYGVPVALAILQSKNVSFCVYNRTETSNIRQVL